MIRLLILNIICWQLFACTHNVQTTSGKDYLSRYPTSEKYQQSDHTSSIDKEVLTVAAVEPQLQFPARIGIAKIMNGRLASMSHEEANLWFNAHEKLGTTFGEFIAVSPLVAEMVAGQYASKYKSNLQNVIHKIRLGAARQHLDIVLLYEVYGKSERSSNLLSLMDLTIVGAYISPGQSLQAEGYAKALLLCTQWLSLWHSGRRC